MLNDPADNDNDATAERSADMRIFIFKSEPRPDLRAFGGDLAGVPRGDRSRHQKPKVFGSGG
jgi:hypothetical protein